jgi:hypothetical protein
LTWKLSSTILNWTRMNNEYDGLFELMTLVDICIDIYIRKCMHIQISIRDLPYILSFIFSLFFHSFISIIYNTIDEGAYDDDKSSTTWDNCY